MYYTRCIILKNSEKELYSYCGEMTRAAKLFKNAVIFRCRQLLFANLKDYKDLNGNTQEVLDEFKKTEDKYKPISHKYCLPSYYHFDYLFKVTKNPDYYNALPMQCTQQIIKEVLSSFKGYFSAVKTYKKNPSRFTGRPKCPHYIRSEEISFDITNQDAVIYSDGLKLPKMKTRLPLGSLKLDGKLKEVTIQPFYDTYKICICMEKEDVSEETPDKSRILGIDLGIDNFITTSNNCGLVPFIINGKIMKSKNQYYNKTLSELQSLLTKSSRQELTASKRIQRLYKHRYNFFNDKMHKISAYIISYCLVNNIGTVVVGKNNGWKQNSDIGRINNQNFCYIPHSSFIRKLKEKAEPAGIKVIRNEESYTSKASFLDGDEIPTYKKGEGCSYSFSGKRVHRGLYKSKDGIVMNADVNGASNIIRKAVKDAFGNVVDFGYLYKTVRKVCV